MNNSKINSVMSLCIEVAELANTVLNDRSYCNKVNEKRKAEAKEGEPIFWEFPSNKKSAALKRRSMDLTRALAEMRRG